LFEIGAIILAVGAVVALIGGYGEVGYIQCIASSGAVCTSTTSTQYITVFLANSEMLSVGLSIVLVGAVIMIGGSITNYLARLGDELKASIFPTRICPKCGAQVAGTSKFCQSCGNKLGE
jgi:ribosomal protein L40E